MSSARRAAINDRSDAAWSSRAIRRSRMPVRSRIQASEVSTIRSRSALVSTRSGTYIPVPAMVAPRIVSSRGDMIGKDLLANVLVDALFDETGERTNRAVACLGAARAMTDEAHTVDTEQRRGAVFLPVDLGLEPPECRPHQQRTQAREKIAVELGADLVRQESRN